MQCPLDHSTLAMTECQVLKLITVRNVAACDLIAASLIS